MYSKRRSFLRSHPAWKLHRFRDHSEYGLSQWETTLQCSIVTHWLSPYQELSTLNRDHFVNEPNQWETTLDCNVVSHWLFSDGDTFLQHWNGYVATLTEISSLIAHWVIWRNFLYWLLRMLSVYNKFRCVELRKFGHDSLVQWVTIRH